MPVLDDDCAVLSGELADAHALRLGMLLGSDGPEAEAGQRRANSARMAVEELNAAVGTAANSGRAARSLVLVGCDSSSDLQRAGAHLLDDLGVHAVLGPSGSQEVLDLNRGETIEHGALTMSPTASAAAITDLADNDLSWTMAPSDTQRAPLLLHQIAELEQTLLAAKRAAPLKLLVLVRGDLMGAGTRSTLEGLQWNGAPLSDAVNLGRNVLVQAYEPHAETQGQLLDIVVAFAPDIVVLSGAAESVTDLLGPFEELWSTLHADLPRPWYVLTEGSKVPELLRLVAAMPELADRVRGIGVAPSSEALPVYAAFEAAYQRRFGSASQQTSGAAASYDAVYALAYAAGIGGDDPVSGWKIARGLRQLPTGSQLVAAGSAEYGNLVSDAQVSLLGTLGRLDWTPQGAPSGGLLEVWCIDAVSGPASFASSGLSYDVASGRMSGSFGQCAATRDAADGGTRLPPQTKPADVASSQPPVPLMDAGLADAAVDAGMPQPDVSPWRGLVVQYRTNNTDPFDSVISPVLRVVYRSGEHPVRLSQLELRYYFSNEHAELCPASCVVDSFFAGLQPSGRMVDAGRKYVTDGALTYLSITFPPSAWRLALNDSVEVQQQIHVQPYMNLDETNDYSFNGLLTDFVDWRRVTLYVDGVLVWGTPPS